MAEWAWEAKAPSGEVRKGLMEADSEDAVSTRLRAQKLLPTRVKKKPKELVFTIGSGVSTKDLVTFTRLLATMINAGLPIVQCLEILGGQQENKIFGGILKDIKSNVEEQGATLSDSLRRHPKVFDGLYTNLIEAGEKSGKLEEILQRLAVYNEKAMKLKRQVRGALMYPSIVLFVFIAVLCVLLGWVIPSFKTIFKDLGSKDELPGLTQMVIWVSETFISYFLYIFLAACGAATGLYFIYKNPKGKRFFHKLILHVPVIGPTLRKIAVASFTRTLGTLLGSGVGILEALEIVARISGNMVVEEGIMTTRARISEGKDMAGPLSETGIFDTMVVQMIGVGEKTGALNEMLNKIADFYEEEVDVAVAGLTSLIEPIMMVGLGGTVGVVLIAMYLPIFTIAGKIKAD